MLPLFNYWHGMLCGGSFYSLLSEHITTCTPRLLPTTTFSAMHTMGAHFLVGPLTKTDSVEQQPYPTPPCSYSFPHNRFYLLSIANFFLLGGTDKHAATNLGGTPCALYATTNIPFPDLYWHFNQTGFWFPLPALLHLQTVLSHLLPSLRAPLPPASATLHYPTDSPSSFFWG